jgi:lysozyme family protein
MLKKLLKVALASMASSAHAGLVCYGYQYAPNLVRAVQEVLKQEGFYAGDVDGKWGRKTKDAVRKFQVRKHIQLQRSHYQYTLENLST